MMKKSSPRQPWQQALIDSITDLEVLYKELGLDFTLFKGQGEVLRQFSLKVPRTFLARMKKNDPNDPLLLQVLPQLQETLDKLCYSRDPLHEKSCSPSSGVLHKYKGRVLLILTGYCAIHCRYCFRRHFPYQEHSLNQSARENALRYIREQTSIEEVILSGGDPLALPDLFLAELVQELESIPHLKRLRIHTRLPVVIPERMTPALIALLSETSLCPVLVTHINHPNEIDHSVTRAFLNLKRAGITLLNQSVLLHKVNDNIQALSELSRRLFDSGIIPYYLHLMDKVSGAAHFEVAEETGKQLVNHLLGELPGYLVPKLVREHAGAESKIIIPLT